LKGVTLFRTIILAGVLVAVFSSFAAAFPQGGDVEVKKGILLVAFGSSMPEGSAAINAVASAVRTAYPDLEVRIAYTSRIIMRKIARERNEIIDEPAIALAKMAYEGFTDVVVLSTHMIPGEEYEDLKEVVEGFRSISASAPKAGFRNLAVSAPLLASSADFERLAGALVDTYAEQAKGGSVVFVGHGTHHFADSAYSALQFALWRKSPNFFVGTIEGFPSYDDVIANLKKTKTKSVTIAPAMLVAGDHAHNDIAGDEPDSWKSLLAGEGYKVSPVLLGFGQNKAVQNLIVGKLRDAWSSIE
jgi:sirohydrochlorin cobaltochelatase